MNPRSHLRLVYEANPLSYIAEQVSLACTCLAFGFSESRLAEHASGGMHGRQALLDALI